MSLIYCVGLHETPFSPVRAKGGKVLAIHLLNEDQEPVNDAA